MNEQTTIPKEISSAYGKDFAFLRSNGLNYIEQLSHKLWTDYNVHDPGVTILEMLCFAITDLGYRIGMPVEDILATEKNNLENMHKQFLSAIHILPSFPVSANDYRQLFVRIDGVRNAWILASERWIVANFKNTVKEGIPDLHYKQPDEVVDKKEAHQFKLQGLNNILIDYDESRLLSDEDKKKDKATQQILIQKKKEEINEHVLEIYERFRNLDEDIDTVMEVPTQEIVICGDIEIESKADPEKVWAQIVFNIEQYLSPDIMFYSLLEMLEMNKRADEIFEGPVSDFTEAYTYRSGTNPITKKGFICKEDLLNSELRTEVRLSDIIRIIMNTEGVKLIKEIAFGFCGCDEKDHDKVLNAVKSNKWNLCISPGHKPVMCLTNSVLNFWKSMIPIELKVDEATENLNQLREERSTLMESKVTEDLPMPLGQYRDISNYQTFQNEFPETYGIGKIGLPETASIARKSQQKQLKAYLLFFDQALANYFSQLANVRVLLTADNSIAQTYFAGVVKGLKNDNAIFDNVPDWQMEADSIIENNGLDDYVDRKNKFLDHLLARFSEQFNEYVFLMHRLYAENADRAVIRHKVNFLKDYQNMSECRSSGFDYYNPKTTDQQLINIPGMEKRISRLLGFNNYKRQPLAKLSYTVEKTDTVWLVINGTPTEVQRYGWSIQMGGATIFESTKKTFLKQADAYEELGLASLLGCDREFYDMVLSPDKTKVSFTLRDTKVTTIATHPVEYDVLAGELVSGVYSKAEESISKIMSYLLDDFKLEGMYVVEHILLRPDFDTPIAKHELFMPVCIESNGDFCRPLDPYSFRITVVLPGYSMRLRNKHFRLFAERLIRMETPAHILPRICFISQEYMKKFEDAYTLWLNERESSVDPCKQASEPTLIALINVLEEMYTVYEQGTLTDCDDDTPEKNPIILGSSQLGSLESDSNP